ncbi:UDP-N-acetylmuramoyl-L-alanyl-D-glutamate--2,6-diaminopimelate ligase [Candidatus Pelagibacter bacterium nBUS_27]|uniref:UDP-N-acetylmuramoyl-L-alanyl-D-glutamate--2, 6-diaminopimelate ligase n=1 Tax=Candidatus Pelagibacter bacterium nBUS_27 TaxID=3374188 RepID=UPI003EB7808D
MLLGDYFKNIQKNYKQIYFSGISFNSNQIKKNNIFFAIKGNKTDGNNFISSAISNGSKIIITEKKINGLKNGILFIQSNNIRKLLAEISFKIYNKIPNNIIAVTGTNGKSSIADFYYQILDLNNKKVASIGTLGIKSKKFKKDLSNTTIDPIQLSKILNNLKKQNINNVIMEASSHGLCQNRLDGLSFNTGIFTNLSQDHLDYHKNRKNYLKAKLYLFEKLIKKDGNIITDEKIPEFKKIKNIASKKDLHLFSLLDKKNNFQFLSHQYEDETQLLEIKFNNSIHKIKLNLIGKVQLKNILMAVISAMKSNINIKDIFNVIPKIKSVEGRFDRVGIIKNNSKVILDYAHTPDALKTCLKNIKEQFPSRKIILVFGCGGDRDQNKRAKMGKIADLFSDKIYLTDDNPRLEQPIKIRKDIKKGIKKQKVLEFPNRAKAISEAIKHLNTGEILLVAGKGHETVQEIGVKKIFFSDKKIILNAIKIKNLALSNNLKINILNELNGVKKLSNKITLEKARINSREIKKDDIFFAIKGKKNDGNKFICEAFQKKASIAVVNKIEKKVNISGQIKVKDTLKFLTKSSKLYRENIKTKIIAITGSCGKTTLKELLGNSLKQISKVGFSPKSYNNKYGVPLSLFNLDQKNDYGVLEIGMDKKGEVNYLSKIVHPDVSVITNINYAHAKNFKSLKQIALAKSEIINNTKGNGFIVLNADDSFFVLHKKIANKRNLKILSFSIDNQNSNIKLISIKKISNKFKATIRIDNLKTHFFISNDFQNNILNILAALSVMSIFLDVSKLNKNIFLGFKIPNGRGDISKIKINNKNINLIDESYNSNPLSLKSAILNFDKMKTNKKKKYLLLGDMLELGKHSKKLHQSIGKIINNTKIDKIFVKGSKVLFTYNSISKKKKGRVLNSNSQIIDLIKNDLNNNDYLMVKASNATGFNKIVSNIKGSK